MKQLTIWSGAIALFVFAGASAEAQCTVDSECKGGRTCKDGACVDPPPRSAEETPKAVPASGCLKNTDCKGARVCLDGVCATPPAPTLSSPHQYGQTQVYSAQPVLTPVPAGPLKWFTGYGEISYLMSFHDWGKIKSEFLGERDGFQDQKDNMSAKVMAGARFAGYFATSSNFHVGGYFLVRAGQGDWEDKETDLAAWTVGVTIKAGGKIRERIFMGLGMDVGLGWLKIGDLERQDIVDNDIFFGLELFPKLVIDIMLLNAPSGFKLALPIAVGAMITPVSKCTVQEDAIEAKMWHLAPALTVGLSLGG